MPEPTRFANSFSTISRRSWLAAGLALAGGRLIGAEESKPEEKDLQELEARARKGGLGSFRADRSDAFLAAGDAPDGFRKTALDLCEGLARSYLSHFQSRNFAVELPPGRLTIVTLAGPDSYAAFLGEAPGPVVGGHYDLGTNWLVMFDFRPDAGSLAVEAERVNTLVLVHECLHLLCFNTGLLDRAADVPKAISEGLAVYGETWRSRRRSPLGAMNPARGQAFALARRDRLDWISLPRLLSEDDLFLDPERQQLAYAESWALVHTLMSQPSLQRRFRAYLDANRARRGDGDRFTEAVEHLVDLDRLEREMRRLARWPG